MRNQFAPTAGSRIFRRLCLLGLTVGLATVAGGLLAQTGPPPFGNRRGQFPQRPFAPSAVEKVTEGIRQALGKPAADPVTPASLPPAETAATGDTASDADDEDAGEEPRAAPSKTKSKSVTPPKASGKGKAKTLEDKAQQCREAREALALYTEFMSAAGTTPEELEQARPRFEFWQQAARDGLVRVGKKWMAKKEADKLKDEADKLVAEALELINIESYVKADAKLERASRVYPDHLESLFLLGVGAFLTDDHRGAIKRFQQCLSRAPENVPLLNNIAVCEVFSKRFDLAVKHWEKAASLEPENPAIVQNLGRFIADAGRNKTADAGRANRGGKNPGDFGNVDRTVLNDATKLYTKVIAGGKAGRYDPDHGYIVLKLFKSQPSEKAAPEESGIAGNGTGFVIAESYVLTNFHVVENAGALLLQDPGNPAGEPLLGKVVASSKPLDLAIVQCNALLAPPAPLSAAPQARGAEMLALGFPVMNVVGKGLKATRGIVTGLPSADTGNLMVLDVQVNPGNSGGPLCDKSGRVVGVVAAKTFTERFVQGYGLAIPMQTALSFIRQHVPEFSHREPAEEKLEWTDVDARISKSTVLILIKKQKS